MYQEFPLRSKLQRITPFLILFIFTSTLFSNQLSRGKKIVEIFCQKEKLKTLSLESIKEIKEGEILKYCHDIDLEDAKDVKVYLLNKNIDNSDLPSITPIPKDARCPVCGMAVSLYPKWSALIVVNGKKIYFDGVKDMMKYYLDNASFHYNRDKITHIVVREFYHMEEIDAKNGWYVIGSNIKGPMGNEFIPFKSLKDAKTFMQDHHGKKIIKFDDITIHLIKSLRLYR